MRIVFHLGWNRPYKRSGLSLRDISCRSLGDSTRCSWPLREGRQRLHPFDRRKGLEGMNEQLTQLLADASAHINANYDVDKLCRGEFMQRMRALSERKGDRLKY